MSVPIIMSGYAPTLGASITNVSASLTLSADSGDNGHVLMLIDTELIEGDKSGTTVSNLTRATEKYNGTALAASHSQGATVYFVLGRQQLLQAFAYKYDEQSVSGGSTATFTIPASGSLPTWANNARIYWKAKCDNVAAQALFLRANGDSGNNYDYQNLDVLNATVTGALTSNTSAIRVGVVADSAANLYNSGFIDIEDLQAATRHQAQAQCYRNDTTGNGLDVTGGVYKIAAALTSFTLLVASSANFTTANFRTYLFP